MCLIKTTSKHIQTFKSYSKTKILDDLVYCLENALCVFRQSSSEMPNQCNKFTTKIQLIY